MDVTQVGASLAIEDEGTVVEIDEVNGDPAWFGGTLTGVDEAGEEIWEGRQRVTITQCGMNSKRYKRVEAWQQREFRRIGRKLTDEEMLSMRTEFLARCAIRWQGFTENGEPLPFTTENVTKAYTTLPFVYRKMNEAMGDSERFFKKRSANS